MQSRKYAWFLLMIVAVALAVLGLLTMSWPTSASPLLQIPTDTPSAPPTNTPLPPPTNTPVPPPTNTPVAPPTNTPVVPPTNTPVVPSTNTPAPPGAPKKGRGGGAPPGPSGTPTVNGCVKSVGKDGVSLSTDPGFFQPHVQIAPRGDILFVVQGPVRADSIWWWRLRTNTGVEGWGNQDNITPDPGPCNFGATVPPGATPGVVVQPGPTPGASALPTTGSGMEWVFLAMLLAAVLITAATWRRRLQMQTTNSARLPEDDDDEEKRRP